MSEKFEVGTRVVLKSGGPEMSVESTQALDDKTLVQCVWWPGAVSTDGAHYAYRPERDTFQQDVLKKVEA